MTWLHDPVEVTMCPAASGSNLSLRLADVSPFSCLIPRYLFFFSLLCRLRYLDSRFKFSNFPDPLNLAAKPI